MEQTGKILVVDDDRVTRRIVTVKLSGLGYDVEELEDGQAAFERLSSGDPPLLVIVDQSMPRMTGLEFVRAVRSHPDEQIASIPIIMLTSHQSEDAIVRGLEAGLDDYVIKPFSPNELAARVRTVLWRFQRASRRSRS